jgi:hypothetical protein
MGESIKADDSAADRDAPAKPEAKREESQLRWPSAATSAGGAYIPSQMVHGEVVAKEG